MADEHRRELAAMRELLEARIDAIAQLLDERYATQTKALDAAFVSAEKAVGVALASAEKAVTKAESATEIRFQGVNEFRQQLADQAATFLPVGVYTTAHQALEDKLAILNERVSGLELRLTSRLDTAGGTVAGGTAQRAESRAGRANASQVVIPVLMVITILISIGAILAAVLR